MLKWKKIAALGLTMVMAATAAACGGSPSGGGSSSGGSSSGGSGGSTSAESGDQITLKFVHKYAEDERMTLFKSFVAAFEEEHPNIHIEMTSYGDEEIKDKIRVLLGSAESPDIYFTWSGERIQQYVDSGNALDITQYVDADSEWKDSFNQTMLNCCIKDGSYYAIPFCYSSKEIVYNKKVFEAAGITELPTTWTEFLDVCQKLKDYGVTPLAVGNQYSWCVAHFITTLNTQFVPEDVLQANYSMETVEYTDPGYAQALDLMAELYAAGYINSDVNSMTWETSQAMVQEGTAGMIYEEIQDFYYYENSLGDDWGYFDFPAIEGVAGKTDYITGGPDVFMVNSDTKYPEECMEFLKYLTGDSVQSQICYELTFLPVTDVELDESQCLVETVEVINKNLEAPGIAEWLDCIIDQTVSDTYLSGCQTIFDGQTGAEIMADVSETAVEVAADK